MWRDKKYRGEDIWLLIKKGETSKRWLAWLSRAAARKHPSVRQSDYANGKRVQFSGIYQAPEKGI